MLELTQTQQTCFARSTKTLTRMSLIYYTSKIHENELVNKSKNFPKSQAMDRVENTYRSLAENERQSSSKLPYPDPGFPASDVLFTHFPPLAVYTNKRMSYLNTAHYHLHVTVGIHFFALGSDILPRAK